MKFAVGQKKSPKKQADESEIGGISVLLQKPQINRTEVFLNSILKNYYFLEFIFSILDTQLEIRNFILLES